MSRNDGRPRTVNKLMLDPLPYLATGIDKELWIPFIARGANLQSMQKYDKVEFLPRPGFIQDEEAYNV